MADERRGIFAREIAKRKLLDYPIGKIDSSELWECFDIATRPAPKADSALVEGQPCFSLAELIETRLLGVEPDDQDLVLEDDDWRTILAALSQTDDQPDMARHEAEAETEYDRLKAQKDAILAKRHDADANKAGGLWYRRWRAAQDELTALRTDRETVPEEAAKVAREWANEVLSGDEPPLFRQGAMWASKHMPQAISALKGGVDE